MEKGCISGSFHRYISWSRAHIKVNCATKSLHLQTMFIDIVHRQPRPQVLSSNPNPPPIFEERAWQRGQPSELEQHTFDCFTFTDLVMEKQMIIYCRNYVNWVILKSALQAGCHLPNCYCRFITLQSTMLSCFGVRMLQCY